MAERLDISKIRAVDENLADQIERDSQAKDEEIDRQVEAAAQELFTSYKKGLKPAQPGDSGIWKRYLELVNEHKQSSDL